MARIDGPRQPERRYRLVVFDWDGTLLDSQARIVECLHAAGTEAGLAALPAECLSNVIGLGMREAITALYPDATADDHARFIERYRHHYLSASRTATPLFAGARELLEGLRRRGALLAIATGKGRRGLDRVLAEHGLNDLFHATRCADESLSKPHPQMLLDILERLGVEPHEALMVGDTEYDIVMARNATVAALGVGYGVHGRLRLVQCGALACVDSVAELTRWLDGCEIYA